MFDPLQSSTYKSQSCSTSSCMELLHVCTGNQLCGFKYSYGDGSWIRGILASETLLFDDVELPRIAFGCVHNEGGPNPTLLQIPGLVGLGHGPLSLVNQIGSSIDNKFAYCLPPHSKKKNSIGQLKFGEDAEFPSTEEVQVTPMAPGGAGGTYYVLTLTDISVGNSRLNIKFGGAQTPVLGDARSIIIDSGTTLTPLANDVYDQVENAVANVISHQRLYPPTRYRLCYLVNAGNPHEGLPEMTFHFANADWKLPPSNTFRVSENGTACLAIIDGIMPVFGNVAQQNMHVKYDLGKGLLSFAPTQCTRG